MESFNWISEIKSFAGRVTACKSAFGKPLGSGSSRTVFRIDDTRVLKVAKNKKGLAQNNVEADHCLKQGYGDVVAKTLDCCPDDTWIVQEYATKISDKDFERYFGVHPLGLSNYLREKCPLSPYDEKIQVSFGILDILDQSEVVQKILGMVGNFQLIANDLGVISAWGKIGDRFVLKDYGLTLSVRDAYYTAKAMPF